MNLGNLTNNKLMSLALQGYSPFQPEVGIFSGAYQGMMYPNPTTLVYPGFDPYQNQEALMDAYTPSTSYGGLGIATPGIDYKHGGHILGILDTFGRMSYGIGGWRNIHAGDDALSGPAMDISVPMTNSLGQASPLSLGDIYPAFTEIPSDWINGFSVSAAGKITPDPRSQAAFVSPGGGHTPVTNEFDIIAMNDLFQQRSIFSYLGMPQYFRSVIEALASAANGLSTLATHTFTLTKDSDFNNIGKQSQWFSSVVDPGDVIKGKEGKAYVQCHVVPPLGALQSFNGTIGYHDGVDGQNEYRSLTELNSVINLVPVQMVGATYWTDIQGFTIVFPSSGPAQISSDEFDSRTFKVASYMIADLIISVSDVPPPNATGPGKVTIAGQATVNNLVNDTSPFNVKQKIRLFSNSGPGDIINIEIGTIQSLQKDIDIYISTDNSFTWDKVWLGGTNVAETFHFNDSFSDIEPQGVASLPDIPLVVPFMSQLTMGKGCTSIRMRAFLKNRHLVTKSAVAPPESWVPEELCHTHPFGLLPPIFHCHTPAGVISSTPAANPGAIAANLTTPNLSLSFTVAGDNVSPLAFNVSL